MSTVTVYPFHYDHQFERFIGQFVRVFTGFQVDTGRVDELGKPIYKRVPVAVGTMDRVVASIMSNRDEFVNFSAPIISVHMTNIAKDDNNKRTPVESVVDTEEYEGESRRAVRRIAGPALVLTFDVSVMGSSVTELLSLVEQILLLFNPRITVSFSSSIFDQNGRSEISLTGVQDGIQYPMGTEKNIPSMTFTFDMNVRMKYPQIDNNDYMDIVTKKTLVIDDDADDGSVVFTEDDLENEDEV